MSPGSVSSSNCPYCPSEEPQYSMIDVMNELKAKFSPDDNVATDGSSVSSSTSSTSVSSNDSCGPCEDCHECLRRGESVPVLGGWLHPTGTNVDLRNDRGGTSILVSTAPSVSSTAPSSTPSSSSTTTGTETKPINLLAELSSAFKMQDEAISKVLEKALEKIKDDGPGKDIIEVLFKQLAGVPKSTTQSTTSSTTGAVGPEGVTRSTTGAVDPEGVKEPANPFIELFKLVSKGMEKPNSVARSARIEEDDKFKKAAVENANAFLSATTTASSTTTSATGDATKPVDLFSQLFNAISNSTGTAEKNPATGGAAVALTTPSSNPFEVRIDLSAETTKNATDVLSNIVKNSKIDSAIDTFKANLMKDLEGLFSSSPAASALASTATSASAANDDSDSCRSAHPCFDPQNPGEDSSSCSMSWTPASSSASSSIDDESSSISSCDRPGCCHAVIDHMLRDMMTCPICGCIDDSAEPREPIMITCGSTNVIGGPGMKTAKGKPTAGTSGSAPASSGPQPAGMTKAELKAGMLALSEVKECIALLGQEAVEEYIDTIVNLPEISFENPLPILSTLLITNPALILNAKALNALMAIVQYYRENCPNHQEIVNEVFSRLLVECFNLLFKPQAPKLPKLPNRNREFPGPHFWDDDLVPLRYVEVFAPPLIELETTITNSRFSTLNFSQKHALRQRWTDYRNDKNSSLSPARRHRVLTMAMGYYQSNTIMTPIEYIQSLPKSFTKGIIDDLCYLINPF
jgi:hypothetical protein